MCGLAARMWLKQWDMRMHRMQSQPLWLTEKNYRKLNPPIFWGVGFSGVGVFSHPLGLRDAVRIL